MPDRKMPGEFEFIRRYMAPLSARVPGAYLLTDDAAVIPSRAGQETVITMDTLVSGVHFLATTPPEYIAAKAVRVNLSDLAAMGAKPAFYTLSLALPKNVDADPETIIDELWLERFCDALGIEQDIFAISIIGGDTVSTPGPLTISVTAIGYIETATALRRSAADVGDLVVVSGTIGDAAFGLSALNGELAELSKPSFEILVERHNRPQPQIELGLRLPDIAHAAIDVSDGLVQDLGHICMASGVGAVVELEKIPVSAAVEEAIGISPLSKKDVLSGGDDYQLLFTISAADEKKLQVLAEEVGVKLTVIGNIEQKSTLTGAGKGFLETGEVTVIDGHGAPVELVLSGFNHF